MVFFFFFCFFFFGGFVCFLGAVVADDAREGGKGGQLVGEGVFRVLSLHLLVP
jgi:hypothetical protein